MISVFIHLIYLLSPALSENLSSEGVEFVDSFKYFSEGTWHKDHAWRHCGPGGDGCMYALDENLRYITNEIGSREERNELKISMRNDCDGSFCCPTENHCTDYTSGQITSTQAYSHGAFTFSFQIDQEEKDHIWTCYDDYTYADNEEGEISTSQFPPTMLPDEVIEECKSICLNNNDCEGFSYHRRPVMQECSWYKLIKAFKNHQRTKGMWCSLKRFAKNLSGKNKEGRIRNVGSSSSDNGANTQSTALEEDYTTPEPQTTIEATSHGFHPIPEEAGDFEDVPELEEDPSYGNGTASEHGGSDTASGDTDVRDYRLFTTSEYTTEEPYGDYTTAEDMTTAVPTRRRMGAAKYCVALVGVAGGAMMKKVVDKISMCIPSWNSKQVEIETKSGRKSFRKTVDLPVDTSKETSRFEMVWLPEKVTFYANGKKLTEIHEKEAPIPKKPLHIKIFVAPFKPIINGPKKIIQQSIRLFKAVFKRKKKKADKTELFVLDDTQSYNIWFIFLGASMLIIGVTIYYWGSMKEEIQEGFGKPLLQEGNDDECTLLASGENMKIVNNI